MVHNSTIHFHIHTKRKMECFMPTRGNDLRFAKFGIVIVGPNRVQLPTGWTVTTLGLGGYIVYNEKLENVLFVPIRKNKKY